MVLQTLRKSVEYYREKLDSITDVQQQQFEVLKGLPFYNWQQKEVTNDSKNDTRAVYQSLEMSNDQTLK